MKKENAAAAVVAILLALIVKAALETMFKPIFDEDQPWSDLLSLHGAQLAVLYLMLLRFYLGTLRLSQMEPVNTSFAAKAINFVFAFLVFSTFYTIALSVTDSGYYFTLMVALHTIDLIWFAVALALMLIIGDQTQTGEIKFPVRQKIMFTFFMLSFATIAYVINSYPLLDASLSDPDAIIAHSLFLAVLFLLSIFDFWLLGDFYFRYEEWEKTNRA